MSGSPIIRGASPLANHLTAIQGLRGTRAVPEPRPNLSSCVGHPLGDPRKWCEPADARPVSWRAYACQRGSTPRCACGDQPPTYHERVEKATWRREAVISSLNTFRLVIHRRQKATSTATPRELLSHMQTLIISQGDDVSEPTRHHPSKFGQVSLSSRRRAACTNHLPHASQDCALAVQL